MEEEKQTVKDWIGDHKKELIIAGVCAAFIVGGTIYVVKHPQVLGKLKTPVKAVIGKASTNAVSETPNVIPVKDEGSKIISMERAAHKVCGHPRNLPKGYKASPEKIKSAIEHGIKLGENQTYVSEYSTGGYFAQAL